MTEEELAAIEEGVREVSGLIRAMGDMAMEIRHLRALPVLVSCADCANMTPRKDEGILFGEVFKCRGVKPPRELPAEDVVPSWCPLKAQQNQRDVK